MMGFGMRMVMQMLCKVCGDDIQRDDEDLLDAVLRGAKAYKVCPGCNKTVSDDMMRDQNYRRRARRCIARKAMTRTKNAADAYKCDGGEA